MKKLNLSWLIVIFAGLSSCALFQTKEKKPEVYMVPEYKEEVIALENLTTRVIAYCYASEEFTAEECADELEKTQGFVRLTNIPRVTANYDDLTTGTYPTRRWRNGDFVPRW